MYKFIAGVIVSLVVVGILLSVAPFAIVGATERGVVLRWGVIDRVLDPGFHWKSPIAEDVETMDVSVQALELSELAYTSDGQTLTIGVTVNYQLDTLKIQDLYAEVRQEAEQRYVRPKVSNALKGVVANYSAQEFLENRGRVPTEIMQALEADLKVNNILVKNVAMTNFDFDDKYEAAISEKQVQEQLALAQVNITRQEEEKKKQEILKAEALSEKTRLEAAALASQNGEKVVAKIYAEAALEAAKKWNGQSPTTVVTGGTDGNIPLFPYMQVK